MRGYHEMGPCGPNAITRILVGKSQESQCQRKTVRSHSAGSEDEEGTTSHGKQAASRGCRREGHGFFSVASRRNAGLRTPWLQPSETISYLWPPELWQICVHLCRHQQEVNVRTKGLDSLGRNRLLSALAHEAQGPPRACVLSPRCRGHNRPSCWDGCRQEALWRLRSKAHTATPLLRLPWRPQDLLLRSHSWKTLTELRQNILLMVKNQPTNPTRNIWIFPF